MRKLLAAVLAAALVAVPTAEAEYLGSVPRAAGYTLEVVTTGRVAVTTLLVTQRGSAIAEAVDVFDGSAGTPPAPVARAIPRKAVRLILVVDAPPTGSAHVKVTAGGKVFESVAAPSATIQLDVVP
jgi:hypothetical protein